MLEESQESKAKKILIVEDDKFLAKMLGRMLEAHRYDVVYAATGKEAIMKASVEDVKLILLDIMLPDIDGFDVLETIKGSVQTAKIPVIVLSNLGQPEDMQQGKALGAIDHLVKSDLSLDEVVAKVRKRLPPL